MIISHVSDWLTNSSVAISCITFALRHIIAYIHRYTHRHNICLGFIHHPPTTLFIFPFVPLLIFVTKYFPHLVVVCVIVFVCFVSFFFERSNTLFHCLIEKLLLISSSTRTSFCYHNKSKYIKHTSLSRIPSATFMLVWSHWGMLMQSMALTFCYLLLCHTLYSGLPRGTTAANEGFTKPLMKP